MKNKFHKVIAALFVLTILSVSGCGGSNAQSKATDSMIESQDSLALQPGDDKRNEPLTIAMVGDIMMGTTYPKNGPYLPADDGVTLFQDVEEIFHRVDITAGNLEGCLFDGEGKVKPCHNPARFFAFKMPERYVDHLVKAGFDFVGVANNHINDFGPEALEATQRVLTTAGIEYAGISDKKPTAIIERDGRKIGFAAFGFDKGMPSINNFEEVDTLVRNLKKNCDILVVCFHGGGEGESFQHVPHKREITSANRGDVERFSHVAVDAGADVVYGHSPHVTRGLELYKDRIIFYSLGNFCTPYYFNLAEIRNYAPVAEVKVNPDGTFASGKIHSFLQHKGVGPRKDPAYKAARKMKELTKDDFPDTPLEISDEGDITIKSNS